MGWFVYLRLRALHLLATEPSALDDSHLTYYFYLTVSVAPWLPYHTFCPAVCSINRMVTSTRFVTTIQQLLNMNNLCLLNFNNFTYYYISIQTRKYILYIQLEDIVKGDNDVLSKKESYALAVIRLAKLLDM